MLEKFPAINAMAAFNEWTTLGAGTAVESTGKQPEAMSGIRASMIIAMAIMETIGVLTFVIAIVLAGKI